ncbi:hypothetical protein Y032_0256g378 [Ancylostoma ceylanicum]|uniref:Uncharacterized protein n=1 Tax=Ancylostoma ceylanicum TaxID=53326 RepID=A0A016SBY3_9BILA|nr:hypothetical protein Y032_0256g378 [Ancylostoma ceylanicum]
MPSAERPFTNGSQRLAGGLLQRFLFPLPGDGISFLQRCPSIGKRPRGRPKQRWTDTLRNDLKIKSGPCIKAGQTLRKEGRKEIHNVFEEIDGHFKEPPNMLKQSRIYGQFLAKYSHTKSRK